MEKSTAKPAKVFIRLTLDNDKCLGIHVPIDDADAWKAFEGYSPQLYPLFRSWSDENEADGWKDNDAGC